MVVFLAASGYSNYDAFEYTEAPTIVEQSYSILGNTFHDTLNCTTTYRDAVFGGDARSAAFSLASLEINGLMDLFSYGPPQNATDISAIIADITYNITLECLEYEVPNVSQNGLSRSQHPVLSLASPARC